MVHGLSCGRKVHGWNVYEKLSKQVLDRISWWRITLDESAKLYINSTICFKLNQSYS